MVSRAVGFIFGCSSLLLSVLMGIFFFKEQAQTIPKSRQTMRKAMVQDLKTKLEHGKTMVKPGPRVVFQELEGKTRAQKLLCFLGILFLLAALALMCAASLEQD